MRIVEFWNVETLEMNGLRILNDYTKPLMEITEVLKWREDILTHGTPLALFWESLTYSSTKIVWEEAFR